MENVLVIELKLASYSDKYQFFINFDTCPVEKATYNRMHDEKKHYAIFRYLNIYI